jgi:hypothetical protein
MENTLKNINILFENHSPNPASQFESNLVQIILGEGN